MSFHFALKRIVHWVSCLYLSSFKQVCKQLDLLIYSLIWAASFLPFFPVNGCMDPWYLVLSIKTQIWCISKWPVLYFKTHTNLGGLKFELCARKHDFEKQPKRC